MSNETRILPTSKIPSNLEASGNSQLENMMEDAMDIVDSELRRYKLKAGSGAYLDIKEARIVQGYMETLIKLAREMREATKTSNFAELSDGELARIASEVLEENQTRKKINKHIAKDEDEL